MAWLSEEIIEIAPRSCRMSSAAIVSRADPAFGEGDILGDVGVEVVTHHQHVEMLFQGVHREGPRRVGGGGQHVPEARHLDDVGRVPAAGALGVEGVDGAALEGGDSVLDEARFVQRVGVDHHLHVVIVGHRQRAVDGRGRRAPVLVQLEAARRRPGSSPPAPGVARRCPCRRRRGSSGKHPPPRSCARGARAPGVQVVAAVPVAGPVPPPIIMVMPEFSASSICWGR